MRISEKMKFMIALILGFVIAVAAWQYPKLDPRPTYTQYVELMVRTPNGIVRGGGHQDIYVGGTRSEWAPPEARGPTFRQKGEAPFVEVSPGRYLFLLLNSTGSLRPKGGQSPYVIAAKGGVRRVQSGLRFEADLADPILLADFSDPNDPRSFSLVDPNDLVATYGPGYAIEEITVSANPPLEQETNGIGKILPWLSMDRIEFLELGGGRSPLRQKMKDGTTFVVGDGGFRNVE